MKFVYKIKILASQIGFGECLSVKVEKSKHFNESFIAYSLLKSEEEICADDIILYARGNSEEEALESLYIRSLKEVEKMTSVLSQKIEETKKFIEETKKLLETKEEMFEKLNSILKEVK